MNTTRVRNGELITSTSTEQDLCPDYGPVEDGTTVLIQAEVVSGTLYFGVGPASGSPIINGDSGTYGSYTTGGKAIRTIDPGKHNLRVVGAGTFIISW